MAAADENALCELKCSIVVRRRCEPLWEGGRYRIRSNSEIETILKVGRHTTAHLARERMSEEERLSKRSCCMGRWKTRKTTKEKDCAGWSRRTEKKVRGGQRPLGEEHQERKIVCVEGQCYRTKKNWPQRTEYSFSLSQSWNTLPKGLQIWK